MPLSMKLGLAGLLIAIGCVLQIWYDPRQSWLVSDREKYVVVVTMLAGLCVFVGGAAVTIFGN